MRPLFCYNAVSYTARSVAVRCPVRPPWVTVFFPDVYCWRVYRRQMKRSKSIVSVILFGDEISVDDAKTKNIRQTGNTPACSHPRGVRFSHGFLGLPGAVSRW